jgi:hypothetical protein
VLNVTTKAAYLFTLEDISAYARVYKIKLCLKVNCLKTFIITNNKKASVKEALKYKYFTLSIIYIDQPAH